MSDTTPGGAGSPQRSTLRTFDMILFSVTAMLLLSQLTLTASIGPSAVVWTLLVITLFFLPYGLMTSELGSTYPDAGGIYAWVVRAFGNRWGSRVSWWYWLNVGLWVPSAYLLFSGALSEIFFGGKLAFGWQVAIAVVLIWVNWWVNVVRLETGAWVSTVGAVITVGTILVLGIAGAFFAHAHGAANTFSLSSVSPHWSTLAIALPVVIYNFLGFELMSSASKDMENPERDVPRATITAGLMIGVFYLVATVGILLVKPLDGLSTTTGLVDALRTALGESVVADVAVTALGIGALYCFFACLIPWTLGSNRSAQEASLEGDLPRIFARTHPTRNTPTGAATLCALVGTLITVGFGLLSWSTGGSIDDLFWNLFAFSSIVFLLPYIVMAAAFWTLRRTDADRRRPYRVPGGPVTAFVVAGLQIVLLAAAVVFFVYDPTAGWDWGTAAPILVGLAATVVLQEVFVARSSTWKVLRAQEREAAELADESRTGVHQVHIHPEALAQVELDARTPHDLSTLDHQTTARQE